MNCPKCGARQLTAESFADFDCLSRLHIGLGPNGEDYFEEHTECLRNQLKQAREEIERLRKIAVEPYEDDVPLAGPDCSLPLKTVSDFLKLLATIKKRFGNTCISFEKFSWGGRSLWVSDEKSTEIERLHRERKELAHAVGLCLDCDEDGNSACDLPCAYCRARNEYQEAATAEK